MITRHPTRRRLAAIAARSGFVVSAVALLLSVVSAVSPDPVPVAAATAGSAQVIVPIGEDQVNGGKLLDSGDSSTDFSLLLPDRAACTGDTAGQDYRIYGYMVSGATDPASIETWTAISGPEPTAYGEPQSDFRQPLYVFTSPYVGFTSEADEAGGPGGVVNIPAFNLRVFDSTENLPLGEYNVGIVCVGPGTAPKVDKFWNVKMTIEASDADAGPVGIAWTAEQTAAVSTSVALEVTPETQAEEGEDVTMTASVTPADAAGDVTFSAGDDDLGTEAVSDGSAVLVVDDLAIGEHALTATFAPTDIDAYAGSTSAEVDIEIVAAGTGTTTTTAPDDSITTTTTTTTVPGTDPDVTTTTVDAPAVGGSSSGGPSTGVPLTNLPLTGGSMSIGLWGVLLLVFGRMAVLLGRTPVVIRLADA